jgi:hypothetical protein
LSVPAGLEGGRLQAEISAGSLAEFQLLAGKLQEVAATNLVAEIFQRLSGEPAKQEPGQN